MKEKRIEEGIRKNVKLASHEQLFHEWKDDRVSRRHVSLQVLFLCVVCLQQCTEHTEMITLAYHSKAQWSCSATDEPQMPHGKAYLWSALCRLLQYSTMLSTGWFTVSESHFMGIWLHGHQVHGLTKLHCSLNRTVFWYGKKKVCVKWG